MAFTSAQASQENKGDQGDATTEHATSKGDDKSNLGRANRQNSPYTKKRADEELSKGITNLHENMSAKDPRSNGTCCLSVCSPARKSENTINLRHARRFGNS